MQSYSERCCPTQCSANVIRTTTARSRRRGFIAGVVITGILLSIAPPLWANDVPSPTARMQVTFESHFDSLNNALAGEGDWMTTGASGWRTLGGNKEAEFYSDASVGTNPFSVRDPSLPLRRPGHEPAGLPFNSGMLTTYRSFSQRYGYFEMRAQLPNGAGLWPAFWLLPVDGSWPPEIDVMESGKRPTYHLCRHPFSHRRSKRRDNDASSCGRHEQRVPCVWRGLAAHGNNLVFRRQACIQEVDARRHAHADVLADQSGRRGAAAVGLGSHPGDRVSGTLQGGLSPRLQPLRRRYRYLVRRRHSEHTRTPTFEQSREWPLECIEGGHADSDPSDDDGHHGDDRRQPGDRSRHQEEYERMKQVYRIGTIPEQLQ